MVAIVSGSSLGLSASSWNTLGQWGLLGTAGQGNNGEQAFVNVATGNLVLQDRDDFLMARGADFAVLRTYNSQGLADDDNGDNWSTGFFAKNVLFSGTLNTAGSTVTRSDRDGARSVYAFDAATQTYISTSGAGAYDAIRYDAGADQFIWTDGDSGLVERYGRLDGHLLSTTDPSGNTTTYQYANGFISTVVSPSGDSVIYDYTSAGRLNFVKMVAADGTQTTRVTYEYDKAGRLYTVNVDLTPENAADNVSYMTTYTYVANSNRLASVTQSDGTSYQFTYVQSRLASVKDGLGQTTSFTYDTTNRRTTVTDALNRVTVYEYDVAGQLAKVTTPAVAGVSQTTTFAYNANGDLVQITDAAGGVIAMAYDAKGNQVLQRDAAGNTVTRTFDANNQVLTEAVYVTADPDGAGPGQPADPLVTRFIYDGADDRLLRFVISSEGRVTEHQYDAFGQRTVTLTYTGARYDTSGLTPTQVPSLGQLTTWAADKPPLGLQRTDMDYDFRGQLQTRTVWATVNSAGSGVADGKQSVTTSIYDYNGQLLQMVAPDSGVTVFKYDGLSRLTTTTDALGRVTIASYDAANNAVKLTLANGLVTTQTFDKTGHLVSVAQSDSAGTVFGTTRFFYDAAGQLTMTQDPTGVRSWNLYDEAGRKVAQVDGDGSLTEYVYDATNHVTHTIAYATAVNTALLVSATGQPLNVTLASIRPAVSAADSHSWNAYDAAGRLVKTVDAQGAVTETRYDGASRVIAVIAYANLISTTALGNSPSAASIAPSASAQDRVQRSFYDADGLLRGTLDGEGVLTEYRYDSAGRLVRSIRYATGTATALRASGTLAQLIPVTSSADAVTLYLLNAKGQVAGEVDAEGYLTERVYDANGNQTQTVRYAMRVTAAVTDSSTVAQLRPAANPQDEATACVYDELNRKTEETDAQGTVTRYSYDSAGNLVQTLRAVGTNEVRTLNSRFDLQGRLTGELTAEGALLLTGNQTQAQIDAIWSQYGLTHAYDAAGRRMSTIDQNGNKTLFFYNVDGQLTHVVNALGEVTETQYDTLGRQVATIRYGTRISLANLTGASAGGLVNAALTSALNPVKNSVLDSKTTFAYNKSGTLASVTDALGFATNYVFNAFGEQVSRTQAIGSGQTLVESLSYDRRGLLLDDTLDVGGINALTSKRYDAFGRVTSWTDADGITRSRNYDRLGRVISTVDGLGRVQTTGYDAFDRVLTQTDPLGKSTTYQYDKTQRSMTVTTPEGVTVTTFFTRLGQTQSVVDGRGNSTTFTYDKNGNLKTTVTALTTSSNVYDRANRLATTIDANGNQVTLGYDAANRVITRTVDPAGLNLITRYGYDAKGQQTTVTDPNGSVTQFTYDLKGQLARQVVDLNGLNLTTSFTYDGRGKTLLVTQPNGNTVLYTYDKLGRRTREQLDSTGLNITRTWAYDALGNLASATDGNGNVSRFAYDAENRLVFSVDGAGDVVQNTYDADGRRTRTVRYATAISLASLPLAATVAQIEGRVIANAALDASESRVYDKDGRLTATVDGTGAVVKYSYDANGNVVDRIAYANTVTGWTPGTEPSPVADAAHDQRLRTVYDQLDRAIFSIDGTGAVVARTYDGNGNVLSRTAFAVAAASSTPATQAALSAAAAQIASPGRDAVDRFVYDKANRLTWSVDGVGAVTRRVYDGNGNVIRLTQYANAVGASADPSTVTSSSAADRVTVATYDAANRTVFTLDALGGVVRQAYDANGNLTQRTAYSATVSTSLSTTTAIEQALHKDDAVDRTERFAFDAANRLAFAIDATGAVTETRYDGAGNAIKTIRYSTAIGTATLTPATTARTVADLITKSSALDRTVSRAFDAANRLVYTVDPMGYVSQSDHDALGRTTRTVLYSVALSATAATTLDGIRQAIVSRPAEDRVQSCTYDSAGRQISCTDALGAQRSYQYNALGEKIKFINEKGDEWVYDYDAAGRMVKETSPSVSRAAAGIDAEGNLTFLGGTLGNVNVVTAMTYDALGNLLSRTEAQGLAEERTTRYDYDALGRQVRTTYPAVGVYHLGNDSAANGATGLATRVDTQQVLTTTTVYNALGDAIAGTDLAGNYSYKAYDKLGHVKYDVDAMGFVVRYDRNAFGEVTGLTRFAQGITSSPGATGLSPTQVESVLVLTAGVDRSLSTEYDRAGRVVKVTEPAALTFDSGSMTAAVQASKITENSYNAFGDLTRALVAGKVASFHYYDRSGQEIASIDEGGYLTTQVWDGAGQLLQRTEYATAYANWQATQIAQATPPAAILSSSDRTTRWVYDRAGRKISETRVNVEVSGNTQLYARADGVLTISAHAPLVPGAFDNTPAGSAIIPGVIFEGGADGSAVLQWPTPTTGLHAEVRWRLAGTEVWTSATDLITTNGSTQQLFIAADFPRGTYDIELVYENASGAVTNLRTGTLEFGASPLATVSFAGSAPTSNVAGIPGVIVTQRDGANVLQWPAPAAGSVATLRFQWPGTTEWVDAAVHSEGAMQYVVIPDGLASGSYKVQLDFNGFGTTLADLVTSYRYDAVGNLTVTTDALGGQSHTYYDALGRVVAVATAANASGLAPLTELFRDAHGNAVGQLSAALGAASVADDSYTRGASDTADRFDVSKYDALGRLTQSTDAVGVSRFYSYTERGDLAKSWFAVADGNGGTATIYEARDYDKLGRLAHIYSPAPAKLDGGAPAFSTTFLTYNAFGEMTARNVDGTPPGEYFQYDNAGRLWKTNSGDGVDRIMLYDVLGRMTKEVRSAGIGGGNANIVTMTADQAATSGTAGVRVTINQYDALGRVTQQILPQTLATASGISVNDMTLSAVIAASAGSTSSINRVNLSWTSLASLGSGDIKVVLSYTSDTDHSITRIFSNEEAAAGAILEWDAGGEGGITSVTGLALFKKDLLGRWQSVVSQAALSAGAHNVTIPAPLDPTTQVILQSRPLGSTGAWLTLNTINFGDKLYFDTAGLGYGSYEYRVQTQRSSDTSPIVTSTGTLDLNNTQIAVIAAPITSGGAFPEGVYGWQSPGAGITQTLRYRTQGSTEVWRSLTVHALGGGFDGVDTSQLAPGTYEYELLYSHTGDLSPYAHATGLITKIASQGTPPMQAWYGGNADGSWTVSWAAVPNTTPKMRWSVLGSGEWHDIDQTWRVETDTDGITHITSPVIVVPGQYSLELSLLNSSGAVVNFSSGTLEVKQGIIAPAEMAPNTPVYTPAQGSPPLPGLMFAGLANGDWTLTWPLPAPSVRTELWVRASGTNNNLQPLAFTLTTTTTQVAKVSAGTLATGNWDIELRQYDASGARIYQNDGVLTVNPDTTFPPTINVTTPTYKPAQNYPDINPTFTANADGSWVLEWPKPADTTWTTTLRYKRSGTTDPWIVATIQNTTNTQKVSVTATQLAKGSYDIELFENSGTTRMAQSFSTVTVKPPVYAPAALLDTTVVYQPAQTLPLSPIAVPGLVWIASTSGGSTFTWTKPPANSVTIFNYRKHDPLNPTAPWSTANTMFYVNGVDPVTGASQQSLTITPSGLTAGDWDVQISQVNLSTGIADAMSSATLTVGNLAAHTLARTWPPLPDVKLTAVAGGGAKLSWLAPTDSRVTAKMFFVLQGSGLERAEGTIVLEGDRQTVSIPSNFWPGNYDVEIVFTDNTGLTTARSVGVLKAVSGGVGDVWTNTTPPYYAAQFATTQGAPEILTTFTNPADGTWSLQWATPPTGTTTSFKYRLVGTTTWLDFSTRVVTSGSTQKASFGATDLAPGNYELDVFFTKNSVRTGQFNGKLSVTSVGPTKATLVFTTPTYVPAENLPPIAAIYTSNPDGTWRLTWPAPPAGSTILARWLPPGATNWVDFSASVQPDGTNQFLVGGLGFAPGIYKVDIAYMKGTTRTAQYTADLTYLSNKVAPTLTVVDSGYRPAENLPYVPGAIFTPGQTDGSWTLTWPHPPAGKFATVTYRLTGTSDTPISLPITTANGIDSITVHNWDWAAGSYDLDLFFSDIATGTRTDQLQGTVTMHTVPRMAPGFIQNPTLYVPTQYLVSQSTDPAGGIISVAQTFVVSAAPTGDIPGWMWMNTNDGGSVFRWAVPPPNTTAEFRYRVLGGSTWIPYPIGTTPDLMSQQAVVGPTFPPGQYVGELTLTRHNLDGTLTVTGYVSGTLYVPVPTATQDLAGLSQPTATEKPLANLQASISQKLDRWGNVLEVTDPRNKNWVTRYRYNANNQVVEQTQPDAGEGAAITRVFYDKLGREIAVQDANGHVADEKKWDAAGNLVLETHADGGIRKYSYSIFGDKIQSIDELGRVTDFSYDKLSRLVSTKFAAAEVSHLENTGTPDWLVVSEGQKRLTQTIAYDQAGRKTSETGTDGQQVTYKYDLRSNIVQSTQAGINTWFEYDTQRRKVKERDGNGAVATWKYDYFGQLTAHTDMGGARYDYAYDNARQLWHQTNDRAGLAMDIGYNYDAAGRLIHITDASNFEDVSYEYDLAGNRIREKTVQSGVVYQDNHLAYDALGRLKWVADGRAYVTMDYDRVGNRTHISTHVINGDAGQDSERWFQYDAMNRQIVADAADEAGNLGAYGHSIQYDKAGQKVSDSWQGNVVALVPGTTYTEENFTGGSNFLAPFTDPDSYVAQIGKTTEQYEYDALGRLITIERDGTVVDQRKYDSGSRTIKSGQEGLSAGYLSALNGTNSAGQVLNGNGVEVRKTLYDIDGRLASERVWGSAGEVKYQLFYTNEGTNTAKIDLAGNSLGYTIDDGHNVDRFTYSYTLMDGYKQTRVAGTRNEGSGGGTLLGSTASSYDANGFLTGVTDSTQHALDRTFVNDVAGNVLYANQSGHVQRQLVVNGEVLGRYGEVVNDKEPKSGDGTPAFATAADFSFGFRPTAGDIKDAAPTTHVVGAGDTLQSISQLTYGDSRLWYVIAEANGLTGNQDLKAGQVLKIPAGESSANASDTFMPYDPSKVVGDTSPFLPAPRKKSGSFFEKFLAFVIEAIATAFLGPVAGNVVGQVARMALDLQDHFSWKSVALSAISEGLTKGLEIGLPQDSWLASRDAGAIATRAAIVNAGTQAIGVATGLQRSFDWKGVAASAAGAAVGQAVGAELGLPSNGTKPAGMDMGEFLAKASAKSFSAGLTAALARGGRIAVLQVASDAFGNAIGQGLVDQSQPTSNVAPPVSPEEKAAILKMFEDGAGDDALRVNGLTFSQAKALKQATNNPYGLPTRASNVVVRDVDPDAFVQVGQDGSRTADLKEQFRPKSAAPAPTLTPADWRQQADTLNRQAMTLSDAAMWVRRNGMDAAADDYQQKATAAYYESLRASKQALDMNAATQAAYDSVAWPQARGNALVNSSPSPVAKNGDPNNVIDSKRPGLYAMENIGGRWVAIQEVDGVNTDKAAVNGMLNSPGYAAWLMGKHVEAEFPGTTKFTLFYNPTDGLLADGWESARDKLGMTTGIATQFSEILKQTQAAARTVQWVAHSQGGIIFSEATRISAADLSNNSVVFHSGGNTEVVTDAIMRDAGIRVLGYRDSPIDPVPNVAGFNTLDPVKFFGSIMALPLVIWGGPEFSPHTMPYTKK